MNKVEFPFPLLTCSVGNLILFARRRRRFLPGVCVMTRNGYCPSTTYRRSQEEKAPLTHLDSRS